MYTDGSVLLTHGGMEMGQGLHTKMIQVSDLETGSPLRPCGVGRRGREGIVRR